MSVTADENTEHHAWGCPDFPPVIQVEMFNRPFPIMHMGGILVQSVDEYGALILALGHQQADYGTFMSLSPDEARTVAAWLLKSADHIDGGIKQ